MKGGGRGDKDERGWESVEVNAMIQSKDERRGRWVKEIGAPAVRRLKQLPCGVGPINV